MGTVALIKGVDRTSRDVVMATHPVEIDETLPNVGNFEITKTEAQWRDSLTPEQFRILRKHGTEWAGSSPLNDEGRPGVYHCAGCDRPLFSSDTKYESHTGWPSFYQPLADSVGTKKDFQYNMERTEVHCARCGGHLGHVFLDGPPPTGERYCINGVALTFSPSETESI